VVNSVSAAVPAPAHQMLGEMKCNFSQFCSCQEKAIILMTSKSLNTPCQQLWDHSSLLYLRQSIKLVNICRHQRKGHWSIPTYHHAIVKYTAHNCRTRARGFW
jgi:hypothetical protein